MSDSTQYAIFADSSERVSLRPRSLGRHRDLETLQLRLATTPEDRRERIRERWGLPSVEVYKVAERARALRTLMEEAEESGLIEQYRQRLQGLQQRLESAQKLDPISYPTYIQEAVPLVFDVESVEVDVLDASVVRRGIEDFLLECEGTSREEVERLQSSLSGSLESLRRQAETSPNGTPTTTKSPR